MKTKIASVVLALCLVAIIFAIPVDADFVPRSITVDKALDAESNSSSLTANSTAISSCRHGVSAFNAAQTAFLETIGFGHYQSFGPSPIVGTSDIDFFHHIQVDQDKTASGQYLPTFSLRPSLTPSKLGVLVENNPGAIWVVGNEPDRGPDPGEIEGGQDDTFPEIYAQAYHDAYYFIKDIDPTAQVAITGLVQVTPSRLQYLDIVWDSYLDRYGSPMPVDIWTVHVYVLPELNSNGSVNNIANVALGTDPSLGIRQAANASECGLDGVYCLAEHVDIDAFAQQVVAMRQWMKAHGQQYKPLIMTEFSSLLFSWPNATNVLRDEYGELFTRERIQDFMNETINYMSTAADPDLGYPYDQNKLVQQWLWFSMHSHNIGAGSNLLNNDQDALRTMGQNFQQIIASQPYKPNLMIGRTDAQIGPIVDGTADVQLSAEIFNNGSQAVSEAMTVRFYRDSALTQQIGDPVQLSADLSGCARINVTASVTWENRSPGVHHYWVKVDTVSNETDSSDNIGEGTFIIDRDPIFIPVVYR